MTKTTDAAKIERRARKLDSDANGGQKYPIPEVYVKRAEAELLAEGKIKPGGDTKGIPVEKLNSQNDI